MLGIEKISKKKLIIYIFVIISVIISGTVFFIYQNYKITSGLDYTIAEINFGPFRIIDVKTYKAVKLLDISVLNSSKFMALKEVIVREVEIEVGNDNPFENPFKEDE